MGPGPPSGLPSLGVGPLGVVEPAAPAATSTPPAPAVHLELLVCGSTDYALASPRDSD